MTTWRHLGQTLDPHHSKLRQKQGAGTLAKPLTVELGVAQSFQPLGLRRFEPLHLPSPEAPGAFNGRPDPSIRHPGGGWGP